MGQAQSQSMGGDCSDCNGAATDGNEKLLNVNRIAV